jgi:SAM-dependent methyltransferase
MQKMMRKVLRVMEAGCQAGRLVLPLAQMGFRVTGIDTSGFALRRARAHALAAGVEAEFLRGDLIQVLHRMRRPQYDMVICAEVVYLSPRYRQMLQALAAAVRPGGLLCVSHRPQFYYLLEALRQSDGAAAAEVLKAVEGRFRDAAYYNWQTHAQLRDLYASLGFEEVAIYPIDRSAWLGKINLARLTNEEREQWLRYELKLPEDTGLHARYALVIGQRMPERVEAGC